MSKNNTLNESNAETRKKLEELKLKYNFIEPNRGNLDDINIIWRDGKPDYTKTNLEYFKGKTMNHSAGSLEKLVEDLVKVWEMESAHKVLYDQWESIDHHVYKVSANGGKVYHGHEAKRAGNYTWLFDGCPKHLYDSGKETFESSHDLFRGTFKSGFAWELLHLFSGPPKVTFTWRHWGEFDGEYRGHIGKNQIVEMYGFAMVTVNDKLKVQNIEIFYKPNEFLEALEGKIPVEQLTHGKTIIGSGCPFTQLNKKM